MQREIQSQHKYHMGLQSIKPLKINKKVRLCEKMSLEVKKVASADRPCPVGIHRGPLLLEYIVGHYSPDQKFSSSKNFNR